MTKHSRQRAHSLLSIYRGEADDFFKLWPPDKKYFFSADGKAFIAYGVSGRVVVCMGDPAGRPESISLLIQEFTQFCKQHRWHIIFIQTTNRYQSELKANGLHSLMLGADAVINLDTFMSETVHNRYFRNIVNRFEKRQFTVEKSSPPHRQRLISELEEVSKSWLTLPHRKEWSFLTGRLDARYLHQVPLYILRDSKGKAQAFVSGLPSYKPGVATIDLMRHGVGSPPNSIDYLFIKLFEMLHEEGYEDFNLGMSPLDGRRSSTDYRAKILLRFYRIGNRFIGFRGLHQFKSKYEPAWELRYVWYEGGVLRLCSYGCAILHFMKMGASPKDI